MSTAPESLSLPKAQIDVARIRADFPILSLPSNGKRLVFLDTAASAQKPRQVIDAERHVYEAEYANIHRGVYDLSQRATAAYDKARTKVRKFINAASDREIVFVRNATEAVNLVAQTWGRQNIKEGDQIILSEMEHHANIVPWQMLREQTGLELVVIPITDSGELVWEAYEKAFTSRTKLVAMTHVSNALGTITPMAEIIRVAHEHGVKVLVDGCQAVPHMPVDVQALDADFYVFSAHKLYGPTGVGALYAKAAILESMPPYQGGGDMIATVTFARTTYADIPARFEAGTPNIAGTIALGAAIDYIESFDRQALLAHEHALLEYATERLQALNAITIYGTAREKAAVISFAIDGVHPHDVGTILDFEGIAVRAGHHCAQPVMDRFGVPATTRASFGIYNDFDDVDALIRGIAKVQEIFA
ncbi:cysteine desulfurase [Iodidimonas sp. SYSU 1G8]|uniref:aminotransferase class V-fold PLP-dependent enzyme n=1 Tax=Iodidimonas sp. SYSU 1G8 TaxID=3133967 RepID=UPI0031FEBDB3